MPEHGCPRPAAYWAVIVQDDNKPLTVPRCWMHFERLRRTGTWNRSGSQFTLTRWSLITGDMIPCGARTLIRQSPDEPSPSATRPAADAPSRSGRTSTPEISRPTTPPPKRPCVCCGAATFGRPILVRRSGSGADRQEHFNFCPEHISALNTGATVKGFGFSFDLVRYGSPELSGPVEQRQVAPEPPLWRKYGVRQPRMRGSYGKGLRFPK